MTVFLVLMVVALAVAACLWMWCQRDDALRARGDAERLTDSLIIEVARARAAAAARDEAWLTRRDTRKVIVHTTEDKSVEGLLAHAGCDGVLLRGARLLGGEHPVAMAGEVFIPADKVALVQAT